MGEDTSPVIYPGDWVRFYRAGSLVIGIVAYVRKDDRYPFSERALTDAGSVPVDSILEVRHAK